MEISNFDIPTLFAGERLCLDFINTSCMRRGVALEFIRNAEELKHWLRLAEGIFAKPLCPDDTVWNEDYIDSVFPLTIALRTALHDLVQSTMEKKPASTASLEVVNAILRTNPTYSQIGSSGEGFGESVTANSPDKRWLVEIAKDAVDLLCHSDLSLLRQCECPTCVRVFYDTTKNHKRRWCVEKCSSQTKAAAYYRRKKARIETARTAISNEE